MSRTAATSPRPRRYQASRRRSDGLRGPDVSSYSAAPNRSASRRSSRRSSPSPRQTRTRSWSVTLRLVHAEHREERLLGDLDRSHPLHPLLAFLLLLEQLPLAGDVAT